MRLKDKLLTSLLLVPLAGTSATAKERANFDAFLVSPEAKSLNTTDAELQARGARVEQTEERLGLPTVLWNLRHDTERSSAMASQRPEQAARAHLQKYMDLYRLNREDISGASLQSVHKTERGPVVARFGQKVEGIEVFRSGVNVVMDRDNNLVAITGYLAPSEAVSARRRSVNTDFQLGAADAIARAFKDLTDTAISGRSLVSAGTQGDYAKFSFEPGVGTVLPHTLGTPARAKKVYFTLPNGLQPAWYVELSVGTKGSEDSDYYSFVISAKDGSLLFRNNLTVEDSFSYRVWADPVSFIPFDGPHGNDATPHPTGKPDGYQAPFIAPNLISLQNYPFSRNDPWLPANATQTTGNNVDAYADLGAPDGFQPGVDLRANTTAPGTFDYTYDVTKAPGFSADQRKAAVAHLFYLNNYLHDAYYDFGFDEASGNAQALNYGRGGLESDSIRAEAQDYLGRNNANMSTPADGSRPRMQMYVFDGVPDMRALSPASVAGGFEVGTGAFGDADYDLTGDLKILDPNGNTHGCEAFSPGTFTGKIALVDRGPLPPGTACGYVVKALNAQKAGAIGVIVANHTAGQGAPGMGGTDPAITVPVVSIAKETADKWKNEVKTNGSTISVRMQRSPNLDRDGTIDNGIVAHEWGHYISNRLVGNANGLSNNQGRSMGEGWADFHAMLMQVQESDRNKPGNNQFQGVYSVAGYTSSGGINNGHYFGIRRVPYSTDMAKNGFTYKHLANGNPLPDHPVAYGATGGGNSEVHNSGEVWATMLWECYVSLLNAYPFQEAHNRMKSYLVAGYKATPNAPTVLEARDALLAVVAAADPADYTRFVNAFAKRGAGFGAKAADRDSADHVGVVESFVTGNNLEVVSIRLDDSLTGCDQDGVLDQGETGVLSVTVRNTGGGALGSFTGTVAASGATSTFAFPNGTTLSFPALQRGASATRTLNVQLTGTSGTEPRAGLTVTFDEPSLPTAAKTATHDSRVHYDEQQNGSATDTFEGALSTWTSTLIGSTPAWQSTTEKNSDGTTRRYIHVTDLGVISDLSFTSPWLRAAPSGDLILKFKYRHSLESDISVSGFVEPFYDGVVLEFSVDGVNWYDSLLDLGKNPGYTGFLTLGDNPLSDRAAFAGTNEEFPGWSEATVNLGTILKGENFRIRFRIGTDSAVGAHGFDLDDVQFTNLTTTPFNALLPETSNGLTCNRRPVADIGQPSRSVLEFDEHMERTTVTLNGSGSFDPDGTALSYTWTQVAGPDVTLTGADTATPSFTANVPADTVYVFQLVVSDGTDSSQPRQSQVVVVNVNRPPEVVVTAPTTVAERSTDRVTLDASASTDADGEELTYEWAQIDGPEVELSATDSATPSFALPEVTEDTQFTFAVIVSDGIDMTEETVAVTVTQVDRAPTANAGEDRQVKGRETVTLQGSGIDLDGEAVTYAWTQVDGPAVTLTGADTATPSFTAPDVKTTTLLRFQLIATAGGVASEPDTVTVTVNKGNRAPVAQGPAASEVNEGSSVTLDASQSTDPDGDALTYHWEQIGGPAVQLSGQDTASLQFKAPKVSEDTLVTFNLIVKDTDGAESAPVQVTVKVINSKGGCSSTGSSSGSVMLLALVAGVLLSRKRGQLRA